MNIIVCVLIGIWLAITIGAARLYPALLAPHCPICDGILEGSEDENERVLSFQDWPARWQMFYCTQCLYRRRLLSFKRKAA
jgi:hypothetical protein